MICSRFTTILLILCYITSCANKNPDSAENGYLKLKTDFQINNNNLKELQNKKSPFDMIDEINELKKMRKILSERAIIS